MGGCSGGSWGELEADGQINQPSPVTRGTATYTQGDLDGSGAGDPRLPTDDILCQDLEGRL